MQISRVEPNRTLVQPPAMRLRVHPLVRRQQRRTAGRHVPDVIMVRHDDLGGEPGSHLPNVLVAQHVAGSVDRKQRDVDVADAVPHLFRRVWPVVAPMENAQARHLDQQEGVVEAAPVVRWARLDGREPPRFVGPVVCIVRAVADMLVGDAGDPHVREFERPGQAVQDHAGAQLVHAVMVEMGVGGEGDIHHLAGEIVKIPVPIAPGRVAPGVNHHGQARGRGDAEGRATEIGKLDRRTGGRRRSLQGNQVVVVLRLFPPTAFVDAGLTEPLLGGTLPLACHADTASIAAASSEGIHVRRHTATPERHGGCVGHPEPARDLMPYDVIVVGVGGMGSAACWQLRGAGSACWAWSGSTPARHGLLARHQPHHPPALLRGPGLCAAPPPRLRAVGGSGGRAAPRCW